MSGLIRKVGTATFTGALMATVALAQGATIDGEVKKIDEREGKITLKHGPAKSLGMDEPMTMVYRVKDPAILKQVKVGDKVSFEAENLDKHRHQTPEDKMKLGAAGANFGIMAQRRRGFLRQADEATIKTRRLRIGRRLARRYQCFVVEHNSYQNQTLHLDLCVPKI